MRVAEENSNTKERYTKAKEHARRNENEILHSLGLEGRIRVEQAVGEKRGESNGTYIYFP